MSDLRASLACLANQVDGLRAALVLETSGIDVATWGEADFEVATAELAALWQHLCSAEIVSSFGCSAPDSFELCVQSDLWVLRPLGGEYLLALLLGSDGLAGKARFYAGEWAEGHREDFK